VGGIPAIELIQFPCPLKHKRIVSMKSIQKLPPQGLGASGEIRHENASADGRRHSDHCEQNRATPEGTKQQRRNSAAAGATRIHGEGAYLSLRPR
jgi:hypothetical protein